MTENEDEHNLKIPSIAHKLEYIHNKCRPYDGQFQRNPLYRMAVGHAFDYNDSVSPLAGDLVKVDHAVADTYVTINKCNIIYVPHEFAVAGSNLAVLELNAPNNPELDKIPMAEEIAALSKEFFNDLIIESSRRCECFKRSSKYTLMESGQIVKEKSK